MLCTYVTYTTNKYTDGETTHEMHKSMYVYTVRVSDAAAYLPNHAHTLEMVSALCEDESFVCSLPTDDNIHTSQMLERKVNDPPLPTFTSPLLNAEILYGNTSVSNFRCLIATFLQGRLNSLN